MIDVYGLYGTTAPHNDTLPDDLTRLLRRAYFACMSFIDDQLGRVLDALDDLGLRNNTVVSFVGDHGYHLGENAHWGKQTNLEQGTHAPMMIRIPNVTDGGMQTDSIVEFVDLFPTLVDAAGLDPIPACPWNSSGVALCTHGASLMPLVKNPRSTGRNKAVSQYFKSQQQRMGYTLRTERYRFVEWPCLNSTRISENHCIFTVNWENSTSADFELYDHVIDPAENVNRASFPEYVSVISQHRTELRDIIGKQFDGRCYW